MARVRYRLDLTDALAPRVQIDGTDVSEAVESAQLNVGGNAGPVLVLALRGSPADAGLEGHAELMVAGEVSVDDWLSQIDPDILEKQVLQEHTPGVSTAEAFLTVLRRWSRGEQ